MFTAGSKYFFGLGTVAVIAAAVYGWGTEGGFSGVITVGLQGSIGEHVGYTVLLAAAVASYFLGGLSIAFRDADADAVSAIAQVESVPEVPAPTTPNYWPAIGALAAAFVVLGLVISAQLFVLGVVVGLVVLLEWMIASWAERATGDPEVNRRIRNRLMLPIEIPIFAAVGIVGLVFGLSRVLLSLDKNASAVVGIVVAVVILGAAFAVANAPRKAARGLAAALLIVGGLGVLVGGVIGAAYGSRTFHHHDEPETPPKPADRNQQVVPGETPTESPGAE